MAISPVRYKVVVGSAALAEARAVAASSSATAAASSASAAAASAAAAAATIAAPAVWQLRCALKNAGNFDAVNDGIVADPGEEVFEAWSSGDVKLNSGDALYDAVVLAIGVSAADAAYTAAASISL